MAGDNQVRKLATILALDVAGYSARTEADERKTTVEIATLRTLIESIAARNGGRAHLQHGRGRFRRSKGRTGKRFLRASVIGRSLWDDRP